MPKFIRTSTLSLKYSNRNKLDELNSFIQEYKRVANLYLDYIWNNNIQISFPKKNKIVTYKFNNKNHLNLPMMLSNVEINKQINLETNLTARSLKCCLTQVLSIVRGNIEKQKKRQFIINKLRSKSKKISKNLRKAIRNKPGKPNLDNLKPELNSVCVDFKETNNNFDAFIKLKSFINIRSKSIKFPVKFHKQYNKWSKQGKRLNSFLFSPNSVDIRYEIERDKKTKGKIIGADQGLKTIVTLSDKQITQKKDKDNYTLEIITDKLTRKQKGSKAFLKTQEHRKNFIHWSINQLNFKKIKEFRLEKVKGLRYKTKCSRYLSHWTYTNIEDKLKRVCEEEEVLLTLQNSVYRSQRCSKCGLVRKSNRKGKVYLCKNCGLEIDADLNASLNHQQDIPDVPWDLRKLKLNRSGFFWKSDGFFSLTGEKLTVSLSNN